jgi:hypothetical protein
MVYHRQLKWRSKTLEEGIRTLLADPDLANKVWNHPLVRGLASKKERAASYIPPNTLALALFDTIVPTGETPTALFHRKNPFRCVSV